MALESNHTCSILLRGPPASAKTLFLQSLTKLKDSYFIDWAMLQNQVLSIMSLNTNQNIFFSLSS